LIQPEYFLQIVDMSVRHDVISEGKRAARNGGLVDHHEQVSAGLAGNVYSLGVLLLEIISGKLPYYSEHGGSLDSSVLTCNTICNDKHTIFFRSGDFS
jgi:serine/threonine protein kinase